MFFFNRPSCQNNLCARKKKERGKIASLAPLQQTIEFWIYALTQFEEKYIIFQFYKHNI